jgi:hypothetical protein
MVHNYQITIQKLQNFVQRTSGAYIGLQGFKMYLLFAGNYELI